MDTLYLHGRKFEHEETKYLNKTVLDAWLITGTRYKTSEYFGEYNDLSELKQTIDICKEAGLL